MGKVGTDDESPGSEWSECDCNCAAFQDDPTRKDWRATTYPTRPAARTIPKIKVNEGDGTLR